MASGILAASASPGVQPRLAVLLLAAGIALGGRTGGTVVLSAMGYLLVGSGHAELPAHGTVVDARARVTSSWSTGIASSARASARLLSWSGPAPAGSSPSPRAVLDGA
jgi:hypothetical protein